MLHFVFIVNPPTYIYFADLDVGEYMIQSVKSYEYPEYALYCDTTYFTINEGEDCDLNLYVYRIQDEIEGVGFTEEDIEAINNENIEIQQQFVEEQGNVSVNTVSSDNAASEKKSGISKVLSIGIATFVFIVILGVALFFYKKGQEEE